MALSKPSVADVIQENENWLRLATFLHEPLKNALLSVLHNSINDLTYIGLPDNPSLLYQVFDKHGNKIAQLVKSRVLQQDQVNLLLPPNDNKTCSSKFDVTLIIVLIINFTTLKPPLNGWKDKNPPAHDMSKGAGVIRGRQWRNYIHHNEPKDIDKAKFNQKWAEGIQVINDLGYHYDTNKLKTISLDPKHKLVLKSLFSLVKRLENKVDSLETKYDSLGDKHDTLEVKHDTLEVKHDTLEVKHNSMAAKHDSLEAKRDSDLKLITILRQQLQKIESEVKDLRSERERKEYSDAVSSGSCCLKSVLEYISKEIKEEEAEELIARLHVEAEGDLVNKLNYVPWKDIKTELEMLDRKDIVENIRKNTLITRGLKNAWDKLREHYKNDLLECLIEQPLSSIQMNSHSGLREDIFIDLIVLPSSTVDEEYTNSDRDAVMKQHLLNKSSSENAVDQIIDPQDELIFIRGVAGIGKSTLIDMFTLQWAKKELTSHSCFDFVFKFTCRELNQILTEINTLEQLFKLQYPEIFSNITLADLNEVSDRILVIVDGLDELKDIYQMDSVITSSVSQAQFLEVIYDLINPESVKALKNHKSIVCGRPKACEFVKRQFTKHSKIKTIEVCGFSHANAQKYILNFFDKNETKAKKIQNIIKSSNNLKVMSTVPVFLWVICNVYMEELIKRRINTNTELFFYTCLVFLRNHFQGTSRNYENLVDIVEDQDIIDVVYSLMVLSVTTYMQNQVLFTDKDIEKLKCPIHLEQTGFIVKYSRSNTTKSIHQFRHLILQEFLCGMYLCVTKNISPFLSNRELSSCLPTILGIDRLIHEEENEIFLHFYNALLKSNKKSSIFFIKCFKKPFRNLSYKKFIKKSVQKLPSSMLKNRILHITDNPECREFLDLFKEANYEVDAPGIDNIEINLHFYQDYRNIVTLLEKLNIKIHKFYIEPNNIFDEHGNLDENILRLYEMTAGSSMKAKMKLYSIYDNRESSKIECTDEKLKFNTCQRFKNVLSLLEKLNITEIHKLYIESENIFDERGNLDENILRLYEMTAGSSMEVDIELYPDESDGRMHLYMECTNEKLMLALYEPQIVKNVLDLLEKLNITKIHNFYIRSKNIFDERGNLDENILRLYEMTAGSSMEVDIHFYPDESDDIRYLYIECTDEKLTFSLYCKQLPSLSDVIKRKTDSFNIELCWFRHGSVPVLLPELTKYAVAHGKSVKFKSHRPSIQKAILKKAGIDTKSEHVSVEMEMENFERSNILFYILRKY